MYEKYNICIWLTFCIILALKNLPSTESFIISIGSDKNVGDSFNNNHATMVVHTKKTAKLTIHFSETSSHQTSVNGKRKSVNTRNHKKKKNNILKTVDALSKSMAHHSLTPKVSSILIRWSQEWQNEPEAWGLLNKPNLLHEIEESMVALELLLDWMEEENRSTDDMPPLAVVDVCCGKGVFSLLASYIFEEDSRVSRIVMLDKDPNVDWGHVTVANKTAKKNNRPVIETRRECNLFEVDETIEWLLSSSSSKNSSNNIRTTIEPQPEEQLALVGIHLCKNLSPTLVGIANALGLSVAPFLCLAPCCLPRVVLQGRHKQQVLEVATFESPMQRQARLVAADRRKNAKRRKIPCILCESTSHRIQQCPLLPAEHDEQLELLFQRAAALEPCWKCGELGHTKKDCPATQQTSSIPAAIPRPIVQMNVSHIISDTNPFEKYCQELSTTVERDSVHLVESKLDKLTESSRQEHRNNWNRNRKTIYIVAAGSS